MISQYSAKSNSGSSLIKIVGLVPICLGILYVVFPKHTVISPLATTNLSDETLKQTKDPEVLRKNILALINNKWSNFSVYVDDLNSDFLLNMDGSVIYTAASVNKIPILSALYYYVEKGEINLDTTVTVQENDIQDYGTGSIRYQKPGSVYSIKTLARLMMKQSDNTAGYILSNHIIGLKKIQDLITSWGLTQTDIVQNSTSNKDIAKLMAKMYSKTITSPGRTEEMFAFMTDTDFEERLPALLPPEVKVYHKIGNEVGVIHDAGIIVSPTVTYYLGIFTSNLSDEEEAKSLQATISKAVYDYLL